MAKKPKCKICKQEFERRQPLQKVCGINCAIEDAKQAREKKERKQLRIDKERVKTRGQWLKEAQVVFNKFIRLRDKDLPCISCQRFHDGQYHAGHYKTVSSSPEIRFDENNVHRQCAPCNNHLSGNIINYRPNLINKIGQDEVDRLEGPQEPLKLTIEQIKELIKVYKAKVKQLELDESIMD